MVVVVVVVVVASSGSSSRSSSGGSSGSRVVKVSGIKMGLGELFSKFQGISYDSRRYKRFTTFLRWFTIWPMH